MNKDSKFLIIRHIDSPTCGMLITFCRQESDFFRLKLRYFNLDDITSVSEEDTLIYPIEHFYTQFEICTNFDTTGPLEWVSISKYTDNLMEKFNG